MVNDGEAGPSDLPFGMSGFRSCARDAQFQPERVVAWILRSLPKANSFTYGIHRGNLLFSSCPVM